MYVYSQYSIPSVFRYPQGILLPGKESMPQGDVMVWDGAKPGPTPHVLLGLAEDCDEDG